MEDSKLSEQQETNPSPEPVEKQDPETAVPQEIEEELPEEGDAETNEKAVREISQTELPRIVEALLFATDEPLPLPKIKAILPDKIDVRKIKAAIDDINRRLSAEHHPYEIVEVAGGYQFRTVQYYHPWVRQLFREKVSRRLSQSALETLAIIAYKQPLTKAEIESIRGVMVDGAMKTLLERRLIRIAGRSEKPGRPLLYETTKDFLRYFGLKHIEDLPKLEEFEQLVKAQSGTTQAEAAAPKTEVEPVAPIEPEPADVSPEEQEPEASDAETDDLLLDSDEPDLQEQDEVEADAEQEEHIEELDDPKEDKSA